METMYWNTKSSTIEIHRWYPINFRYSGTKVYLGGKIVLFVYLYSKSNEMKILKITEVINIKKFIELEIKERSKIGCEKDYPFFRLKKFKVSDYYDNVDVHNGVCDVIHDIFDDIWNEYVCTYSEWNELPQEVLDREHDVITEEIKKEVYLKIGWEEIYREKESNRKNTMEYYEVNRDWDSLDDIKVSLKEYDYYEKVGS